MQKRLFLAKIYLHTGEARGPQEALALGGNVRPLPLEQMHHAAAIGAHVRVELRLGAAGGQRQYGGRDQHQSVHCLLILVARVCRRMLLLLWHRYEHRHGSDEAVTFAWAIYTPNFGLLGSPVAEERRRAEAECLSHSTLKFTNRMRTR